MRLFHKTTFLVVILLTLFSYISSQPMAIERSPTPVGAAENILVLLFLLHLLAGLLHRGISSQLLGHLGVSVYRKGEQNLDSVSFQ